LTQNGHRERIEAIQNREPAYLAWNAASPARHNDGGEILPTSASF
jgi:hypothetical protein